MSRDNLTVENNKLDLEVCDSSISIIKNNGIELIGLDLPKKRFSLYFTLDSDIGVSVPEIARFHFDREYVTTYYKNRKAYITFTADNFNINQLGVIQPSFNGKVLTNASVILELGYGFKVGMTNNNLIYNDLGPNNSDAIQDNFGVSGSNQYAEEGYDITNMIPTVGGFVSYCNRIREDIAIKTLYNYNENFYFMVKKDQKLENTEIKYQLSQTNYKWTPNNDGTDGAETLGTERKLYLTNLKLLSEYNGFEYKLSFGRASVRPDGEESRNYTPYLLNVSYENKLNTFPNFAYYADLEIFEKFNIPQAHCTNTDGFVKGVKIYTEFVYRHSLYDLGGFISYENDNRAEIITVDGDLSISDSPEYITYGINMIYSNINVSYSKSKALDDGDDNEEFRIKFCGL